MNINRPTKCTVYFSSQIMTSRRVRGELQSKGLSGVPSCSTKKHTDMTYKVAIVIFICVKRDEHYKVYHMTICIYKTCYMIVQKIKVKLFEFSGLCN